VKSSLLKPFRANPKSAAIPENDLQPIVLCVRKQKEMAAQGVAQQLIAHQTIQPINPFAHVRCARRHVDPRCRAHSEHGLQPLKYGYQLRQRLRIEAATNFYSAAVDQQHRQGTGKLPSRNRSHGTG
jgi:hypothetical protein